MNRIDTYRNIHKGIRLMLCDLLQKSGRTDFTDAAAVTSLRADVAEIFELLEGHAHKENEFFMPLVRKASVTLAREFDEQHEDQESRLPGLLAALESFDPRAADADRKGHLIVIQLSRITGELLTHMADEELQINPALWASFTDEEIGATEQRLIGSIPPPMMGRYLTWMIPALNRPEREAFVAKLPPPVQEFVATLITA
jgi:iron-sulfur cluster repair protein YtfE (RIC family)